MQINSLASFSFHHHTISNLSIHCLCCEEENFIETRSIHKLFMKLEQTLQPFTGHVEITPKGGKHGEMGLSKRKCIRKKGTCHFSSRDILEYGNKSKIYVRFGSVVAAMKRLNKVTDTCFDVEQLQWHFRSSFQSWCMIFRIIFVFR